jgi:hypothetical protein
MALAVLPSVRKRRGPYREALARAEALGMRPLVAHCHLGLGRLHRDGGRRRQAREHLAAAIAMYADMAMAFWREQGEALPSR